MYRSFVIRTFCAGFALCLASACAHGKNWSVATGERGIAVVGTGKASAPPDIARTNIGVEVRAADVQQAVADATARMTAVTQAIKALAITDKDLRTHSFSVGFEQEPTPPPMPVPAQRGVAPAAEAAPAGPRGYYRVSNTLEVTIRDLTAVGRVLSAATAAGANNVWGINFEIENTDALKAQARSQAIQRAKQVATELASSSGVELGKLQSISEGEPESRGGPVLMSMRAAANEDVPIERGEITVNYAVRVVYDVRQKD